MRLSTDFSQKRSFDSLVQNRPIKFGQDAKTNSPMSLSQVQFQSQM